MNNIKNIKYADKNFTGNIIILDTNICTCLFPKGHQKLKKTKPESIDKIKTALRNEMKTKRIFITNTIKKELRNIKLTKNNTLLNYIFFEYKIELLKDDTSYLNYVEKLCNDAYYNSENKISIKNKTNNKILKTSKLLKIYKDKYKKLVKECPVPNEILDKEISRVKKRCDGLKKSLARMKEHKDYAFIENEDRTILSTALSIANDNQVVEFFTGDAGFLPLVKILKERSIKIQFFHINSYPDKYRRNKKNHA